MQTTVDRDWSENQKRAYIAGTDGNLFVEAGAGAGKSTRLARRIVEQLRRGASLSSFVVITCTPEAADELRTKIEKQLRRAIPDQEGEARAFSVHLLRNLSELKITTVYDFCRTIAFQCTGENYFYGDQALHTLCRIIGSDAEVRKRIQKGISHLYVDEFQDTDHEQKRLIWLLAQDETSEPVDGPVKKGLRDNTLFVIGDAKQSVYGCLNEQVEAFDRFRARMMALDNCEVIVLRDNFRSGPEIVSFVNEGFSHLIPRYVDMISAQEPPPEGPFPVSGVYRSRSSDTAGLIKRLLNSYPSLGYDDFLIVIHREEELQDFALALAAAGIPIVTGCREYGRSQGAVQVMDARKAKSLNSNIVIVTGVGGTNLEDDDQDSFLSLSKDKRAEFIRDHGNLIRLEYVAATRAKHMMIFVPAGYGRGQWFGAAVFGMDRLPEI